MRFQCTKANCFVNLHYTENQESSLMLDKLEFNMDPIHSKLMDTIMGSITLHKHSFVAYFNTLCALSYR